MRYALSFAGLCALTACGAASAKPRGRYTATKPDLPLMGTGGKTSKAMRVFAN